MLIGAAFATRERVVSEKKFSTPSGAEKVKVNCLVVTVKIIILSGIVML